MKRICLLLLLCMSLVTFSSCRWEEMWGMPDIGFDSPNISGVVEQCYADKLALRIADERYPDVNGLQAYVSLDVRMEDSLVRFAPGDDVRVYYNGVMSEGEPVYINEVYTIKKIGK